MGSLHAFICISFSSTFSLFHVLLDFQLNDVVLMVFLSFPFFFFFLFFVEVIVN